MSTSTRHPVAEEGGGGLSALQQWQALYRSLLAQGHSTLDAIDLINSNYPGLGLAAKAEHARTCAQAVGAAHK
jgi:hypothetical protein